MAGYIIAISKSDIDSLNYCIENCIYSTILKEPKKYSYGQGWHSSLEGTFADYSTMKNGDNIYFFSDRKIYGIGSLLDINGDCKFNNYPGADTPNFPNYKNIKDKMILNSRSNINNRWLCTFEPAPNFFKNGVDMDDVLLSSPSSFRMLRAFSGLSFIKVDDKENKALKDIILKRNEDFIDSNDNEYVYSHKSELNAKIRKSLPNRSYNLNITNFLQSNVSGSSLRHEMVLEAGLLWNLTKKVKNSIDVFGEWDYLSHQVIASPFKPLEYTDQLDVFGYRYIPNYETISKYLVVELKIKDATSESIDQTMKYVDWINQEYTFGDYSMIDAFIVAHKFSQHVIDYRNDTCVRNYAIGRRPTLNKKWSNITLVKYNIDTNNNLIFQKI